MSIFNLTSAFEPKGDQPQAIKALTGAVKAGLKHQVLLGVTGSGKTFTIAHVIANCDKPTLVLAPNKTLAGQLYAEFRAIFPQNAVEYFVSYYDYYQPEAYIPTSDTYIQKDSSINEMIDKMRHSATRSVLARRDVIVVASVSCIFGLGAPEDYLALRVDIETGTQLDRDALLKALVGIQYKRNDIDFSRGVFRVRGDRVEIFPAYEDDIAVRVDFFGDEVEGIAEIDPLRGSVLRRTHRMSIYPASHYVTQQKTIKRAIEGIIAELKQRVAYFRDANKLIEAQRIEERTQFDLEMMLEMGYCNGIENYSRYLTGRAPGEPPPTLFDYFPDDFLLCIDESHIAVPQLRAMYSGDRSRKTTLAEYGFRLPSALDNRPLRFDEFTSRIAQVIYISATPADYELELISKNGCQSKKVEQIVRPTGLPDPIIEVKEARFQVDDLLEEIHKRIKRKERILVTTLTKRMAEDLTDYYEDLGVRVRYMHSDISTLERMDIIRDLRAGDFDVLVGINLLREGLDIPEVSLVAILDADKEGFLRSVRSLVQTCGRASRNVRGSVIMYADRITKSMQLAIDETERRRKIQIAYNTKHNITPVSVHKVVASVFADAFINDAEEKGDDVDMFKVAETVAPFGNPAQKNAKDGENPEVLIKKLEKKMHAAARDLEFERAADLRDQIKALNKIIAFG